MALGALPENIDGTDVHGVSYLASVSCPSASFCVAVDWGGRALTYDGSSWSVPLTIDPGHALSSVSCPSELFCAAVDYRGNVLTYRGAPPSFAPPPTGSSPPSSGGTGRQETGLVTARVGRVRAHGLTAKVPLKCTGPAGTGCKIALTLRPATKRRRGNRMSRRHSGRKVGGKTARIRAGDSRIVRIRLNATGRRLLRVHRRLPVRLRATQNANGRATIISVQKVTFKLRRHRRTNKRYRHRATNPKYKA